MAAPAPEGMFPAVSRAALGHVPGTQFVGLTWRRHGHLATLAPSDPGVAVVDRIQEEIGTGPCLDDVRAGGAVVSDDLRGETRWAPFGSRAFEATGIVSMAAFRIDVAEPGAPAPVEGLGSREPPEVASLNLYSTLPAAFDATSVTVGLLLSGHATLGVAAHRARDLAEHLQRALVTNRRIGIAIGILMRARGITDTQAHDLLRHASQDTNTRLADVADRVVESGDLDLGRDAYPSARRRD